MKNENSDVIHFGGHDDAGAEAMEHMGNRLGLSSELIGVMEDAAKYHMDFHDVPQMSENELLEFFDNFVWFNNGEDEELPTNNGGETIGPRGITPHEMIDVACADHEGRLKTTFVDSGGGVTDTKRRCVARPSFDRDPFERRLEAVFRAKDEVDGYEALESGMCDEHGENEIDRNGIVIDMDQSVQAVMSQCPNCRTPGDWVGQTLEKMKLDHIEGVLVE